MYFCISSFIYTVTQEHKEVDIIKIEEGSIHSEKKFTQFSNLNIPPGQHLLHFATPPRRVAQLLHPMGPF